jgi:hypothetical protein
VLEAAKLFEQIDEFAHLLPLYLGGVIGEKPSKRCRIGAVDQPSETE